jgi:hypothetical protein
MDDTPVIIQRSGHLLLQVGCCDPENWHHVGVGGKWLPDLIQQATGCRKPGYDNETAVGFAHCEVAIKVWGPPTDNPDFGDEFDPEWLKKYRAQFVD